MHIVFLTSTGDFIVMTLFLLLSYHPTYYSSFLRLKSKCSTHFMGLVAFGQSLQPSFLYPQRTSFPDCCKCHICILSLLHNKRRECVALYLLSLLHLSKQYKKISYLSVINRTKSPIPLAHLNINATENAQYICFARMRKLILYLFY